MADALFSHRFSHDWAPLRAPLFPLALKVSFYILGRRPLAAVIVSGAAGLFGVMLLGFAIRRTAGEWAAGCSLIFVSLYPTLVTYEHVVLTETGTFFFVVLACTLMLWKPASERARRMKALLLAGSMAVGFYWRQTLLCITTPAVLITLVQEWRCRPRYNPLARAALLFVLPLLCSRIWDHILKSPPILGQMLGDGIIRQALLPLDDPYVAANRDAYIDGFLSSHRRTISHPISELFRP